MRKLTIPVIFPLLCLSVFVSSPIISQTFNVNANHPELISLDGNWRFHTGDNPAWASPNFDDSHWSLLRSDQNWTSQGFAGYSGLAWYRFQVTFPPNLKKPSILLPEIDTSYEIFADGKLIGSVGGMPPHAVNYFAGPYFHVYALPPPEAGSGSERNVEFAIRVWLDGSEIKYGSGPDAGGGLVGEAEPLIEKRNSDVRRMLWVTTGNYTVALLQTLAGLGGLILFLLRRRDSEYLAFSILMISTAATDWIIFSEAIHMWNTYWLNCGSLFIVVAGLASIVFYQKLIQPQHLWLPRLAAAFTILGGVIPAMSGWFPEGSRIGLEVALAALCQLPLQLWILFVLYIGVRKRSIDARLLVVPVTCITSIAIFGNMAAITDFFGWQHTFTSQYVNVVRTPFPIELHEIADFLFLLGVFAILVLRFTRTSGEQERYATEVEGARHVQQFLIPDDLPQVPGLTIESDYRPAREVGGDFFQIIPDATDGSALVLVGDVAGKGMQAGMLATLLVGAMRTAATFTRDPAVILSTLNNRLCGKGNATCLALRIEADGRATLVNAGHLPPYLNGVELPMEGALPLGTISNLDFPILHFEISPGDTLTLISDGILEAQRPDGELFGFERITELLAHSSTASSLATAAQEFGQEDDITVLTIAREARPDSLLLA
jgi:phosphoserine phosphatase RsbU/P